MKAKAVARVSTPGMVALFFAATSGVMTYGQTWIGAGGGEWGTASNWTPATVPNAIDAAVAINSALTVNVSNLGGTYPYTFGSLATSISSSSVIIGSNSITTDILNAQVSSGQPSVNVSNSGGTIFFYANLAGTQGIRKDGAGKFTFRFNGADHTYTGNVTINAGVFGIDRNGSLGDSNNDIFIANGARLLAEPGSNTGTITLPSTRVITLTGAQSQIGVGNAAVTLIVNGNVTENSAGQGLVKTDPGLLTLAGTLSYTGETRIAAGTLALSGPALLPSGQNLRFNGNAVAGTLNVGGTSQTVRTIVMDQTNANRTITGTSGSSFTVNGDADLQLGASNGVVYDFSGVDQFRFDRSTRPMNFQTVNVASVTSLAELRLSKLTNTVIASQLLVGGGNSDGNNGNTATLRLGTTNTIRSTTFQIGGFNAGGVVNFQSGLTNPSLTLRGTDGVAAMTTLKIGESSSGTRRGEGVLNLTGGSIDGIVTNMSIGRHIAGASINDTSSFTMPDGTLVVDTLTMAEKTSTGTPTLTATFTQGNGTVSITNIVMGKDAGAGATPKLLPTYNLNGGTLRAANITAGSGAFAVDSLRTINIDTGTLRNLAGSNLAVDGVNGTSGGKLNIVLGTGGGKFEADLGRSITINSFASVSGAGTLTKLGQGDLVLNSSTTNTGGLIANAGSVTLANTTIGGASVTINSPATLRGTGTVSGAATVNGNLSPGTSAGKLTFNGGLSLGSTSVTTLELESGATLPAARGNPGGYDAIDVAGGTLSYDGTLNVDFGTNTFSPGDSFTLFDFAAGTHTGNFSAVNLVGTGLGSLAFASGVWSNVFSGVQYTFSPGSGVLDLSLAAIPEPLTAAGALLLATRVLGRRDRRSL